MLYRFSKRVIVDSYNNGFINTGKHQLFSVYDGENLVGEFYYNANQSFFYYGDTRIKIGKVGKKLFKDMSIIDDYTDTVIGKYASAGSWIKGFREKILLYGIAYIFQRIKPPVKFSYFKRDTWHYYRYKVGKEIEEMIYTFKLDIPHRQSKSETMDMPFEGTIEVLKGDNKSVLFATFYLIGDFLEEQFIRMD